MWSIFLWIFTLCNLHLTYNSIRICKFRIIHNVAYMVQLLLQTQWWTSHKILLQTPNNRIFRSVMHPIVFKQILQNAISFLCRVLLIWCFLFIYYAQHQICLNVKWVCALICSIPSCCYWFQFREHSQSLLIVMRMRFKNIHPDFANLFGFSGKFPVN